jgi:hypothetical protein
MATTNLVLAVQPKFRYDDDNVALIGLGSAQLLGYVSLCIRCQESLTPLNCGVDALSPGAAGNG